MNFGNSYSPLSLIAMAAGLCLGLRAVEGGGGNTILDLDSMMDTAMDSIETLPDFVNPPAGDYMLATKGAKIEKYTPKGEDGKPGVKDSAARIRLGYAVEETIQTKEMPVGNGSLFSESFMFTEQGIKFFKQRAMQILNVKDFEGATLRDVISALDDVHFKAKVSVRTAPNPAGGQYENVQVRPIHETPAV